MAELEIDDFVMLGFRDFFWCNTISKSQNLKTPTSQNPEIPQSEME